MAASAGGLQALSVVLGGLPADFPLPVVVVQHLMETQRSLLAEMQRRILDRLYFALRDDGYIFLGRAEMLLTHARLFKPYNIRQRVFSRVPSESASGARLSGAGDAEATGAAPPGHLEAAFRAWDAAGPPHLVIDARGALVHANASAWRSFDLGSAGLDSPIAGMGVFHAPVALAPILREMRSMRDTVVRDVGLAAELRADDPRREKAAHILETGTEATRLAAELLTCGLQSPLRTRPLDPGGMLGSMRDSLRPVESDGGSVALELEPDLWLTACDEERLRQVVVALVANAREARAGGVTVTIRTANIIESEESARLQDGGRAGAFVSLVIADDGPGMDAETCARVWEPFFTTRAARGHRGLGLSTAHGLVIQSGGSLRVEAPPGSGTCVRILLPRYRQPARGAIGAVAPPAGGAALAGPETILVVDDDAAVCAVLCDILGSFGYRVLAAAHGEEALARSRSYEAPIHILLTDMERPGLGGPALASRLSRERRGLIVVFMSGHCGGTEAALGVAAPFVSKPFEADALGRLLRRLLDA